MARFLSLTEKIEILKIRENSSMQETADIFNRRFPDRLHPLSKGTISKLEKKFLATGSLNNIPSSGRPSILRNNNEVDAIVNRFRDDPHASLRRVAVQVNLVLFIRF